MNASLVAVRYAKALFEYATDAQQAAEVYTAFKHLSAQFRAEPLLAQVLSDRALAPPRRKEVWQQACGTASHAPLERFFDLVVAQHREELFPRIVLQYIDLYRNQNGIRHGVLTTAHTPSDASIDRVKTLLASATGDLPPAKEIELEVRVDRQLIGGFTLETGMQRLDASVATQLKRLGNALSDIK